MKKILKILLLLVIILPVVTGIAACYISLRAIPTYATQKINIKVEPTFERVERGTKLASMLCRNCHFSEITSRFSGKELTDVNQFGKIYAANITQDPISGIGKWSDGEIIYLLRTGLKPDGQYIPPYMPNLVNMSDEDIYSIVAFLRSRNNWVQPVSVRQPVSRPSFFSKFLVTIGAFKPFGYPSHSIPGPDTTNMVKWGKYIACQQLECFKCHSKDFATNNNVIPEQSAGFFGGGNKMYTEEGKKINTANITMDKSTGIGNWTEEQFIKAVRMGIVPNGEPALRSPMQPYINLTDKEVSAIYAYLKTIPVIHNKVDRKTD
jgi:hypothetical protein